MLLRMNTDKKMWGPRLYAYLEAAWTAAGSTREAWAREHDLTPTTVRGWGEDAREPSISNMQVVARALGVELLDVLVIAGILDETRKGHAAPLAPEPPTIAAALSADQALTKADREKISDFAAMVREARGRSRP